MRTDAAGTSAMYLNIRFGKIAAWRAGVPAFVERTRAEPGWVHFVGSIKGAEADCREGYVNAAALLAHFDNAGALLQDALRISHIARFEVHGRAAKLDELGARWPA